MRRCDIATGWFDLHRCFGFESARLLGAFRVFHLQAFRFFLNGIIQACDFQIVQSKFHMIWGQREAEIHAILIRYVP